MFFRHCHSYSCCCCCGLLSLVHLHRNFNMSPSSVPWVDIRYGHWGAIKPFISAQTIKIGLHPLNGTRWVRRRRGTVPDKGLICAIVVRDEDSVRRLWIVSTRLIRQPGAVPLIYSVLLVGVVLRKWIVWYGAHIGRLDGVKRWGSLQVVRVVEVICTVSSWSKEG